MSRVARTALLLSAVALCGMMAAGAALAAQGASDWNQTVDTLEGGVGLHLGKLGGNGLAFRVPLRWYLYLQTAGGIWHTHDDKRHNMGFELNYILRQDSRLRLYLAGGTAFFYHKKKAGTVAGQDVFHEETNWNVGAGLGVEVLQGRRWSWQLEADFVHDGRDGDTTVAPQVGIYYYW